MVDVDKLDPSDPRAPYLQVADTFRRQITDGVLAVGSKLPGYDAVAAEYGVARGTVKRALETLQDEGLVVIRHGQGSFVRAAAPEQEPVSVEVTLAEMRTALAALTTRVEQIERQLADQRG